MMEIHAKILELLRRGEPAILATIIRLSGSGPRGVGAKLLVPEKGSPLGTIGGGLLEARVLEESRKIFPNPSPVRLSLSMMGRDVEKTEMLCGGDVEVFLDPILPSNPGLVPFYERVEEIHRSGGSWLEATRVSADFKEEGTATKLLIEKEGGLQGTTTSLQGLVTALQAQMSEILRRRKPVLVSYRYENGRENDFFVEPLAADPVVYVFGGGHVSAEIVPLASHVGFQVVVLDDRPEFADSKRFPQAREVIQMPFQGAVARLPINKSSYMVIVTRGHAHDKTVLEQCLRSEAGYIGMIGSRRKRAIVYEKLMEEGFTRADLDRVHSPIGLDIGAETPEEIGVSIVSELIRVRAGKEEKEK